MIPKSLVNKLIQLQQRLGEINHLLSQPEVMSDQNQLRTLGQERSQLEPIVHCFHHYQGNEKKSAEAQDMLKDPDPLIREIAQDEIKDLREKQEKLGNEMQVLLLPRDPHDDKNIFIEIRAGTGGLEAALFAKDLTRMYCRYAEMQKWRAEIYSAQATELDGYREVTMNIIGKGAYSKLKFESGVHRVQRVPETEAQGRLHTSTCTVAVLPEADEIERIVIDPADLRVDTFRASGAGGQHVNKTDSAVRITHMPTQTVVECQEERSQHKNRTKAMALLQTRLLADQRDAQSKERAESRRLMVGTGERSERIRTYNFPQNRLTDHRIGLTLYKLDTIMLGMMDPIIDPLTSEQQARALADYGMSDDE